MARCTTIGRFRMKIRSAVIFAICFVALTARAGSAPMPERGPHGSYPARVSVQTNADELILRLTNTVPGVNYLVMVRSNQPYAQWLQFTEVIAITNSESGPVRFSLKSGEAEKSDGANAIASHSSGRVVSNAVHGGFGQKTRTEISCRTCMRTWSRGQTLLMQTPGRSESRTVIKTSLVMAGATSKRCRMEPIRCHGTRRRPHRTSMPGCKPGTSRR